MRAVRIAALGVAHLREQEAPAADPGRLAATATRVARSPSVAPTSLRAESSKTSALAHTAAGR
jgi:hypothetical protein